MFTQGCHNEEVIFYGMWIVKILTVENFYNIRRMQYGVTVKQDAQYQLWRRLRWAERAESLFCCNGAPKTGLAPSIRQVAAENMKISK